MLKVFTLVPLLFSVSASAALTVVADLGGEPMAPLFAAIAPVPEDRSEPAPVPLTQAIYPVVSTRLHPGSVALRSLSLPGMPPVFLLGDDPLSIHWLEKKRQALSSLHAVGLVVNVASAARFQVLQQHAGKLLLVPVSGDDMAQRLKLEFYPVLITNNGLSQ
ncbi:MAG: integrating conjugative element protein [Scandinavium sp.]|uniref:integrating conjugative element protein n=1 Tax=Scandinavium sp. TaxID=2830653 RepID=UPI003F2D8198